MTEKWDFLLYLEAGASVRYQDKTLVEMFGIITDWPARSNSPVASFRARRARDDRNEPPPSV